MPARMRTLLLLLLLLISGRAEASSLSHQVLDPLLSRTGSRFFASRIALYTRSASDSKYAYCGGNPVNRVDPSGLIDEEQLRLAIEQLKSINTWGPLVMSTVEAWLTVEMLKPGSLSPQRAEAATERAVVGALEREAVAVERAAVTRYVPRVGRKLDYLFGMANPANAATAERGAYNVQRSKSMLIELQKIGINNTKENRKYVYDAIEKTLNTADSIVAADAKSTTRETLLYGPKGAVKLITVWDNTTLITVKVFGVK
ncbi:hypothetical protein DYH09_28945 [bacterium CPR1]|nr:hypothetical protein [bacterium CPR1]